MEPAAGWLPARRCRGGPGPPDHIRVRSRCAAWVLPVGRARASRVPFDHLAKRLLNRRSKGATAIEGRNQLTREVR